MHYFNYAGLSPARAEAVEAMQCASGEFGTQLFSESGIAWYRKQADDCRNKVARLLHVKLGKGGHSLIFVPNATSAYRIALSLLEFHQGDAVITSDQEHPSTLQALCSLKRRGVELIVIPAGSEAKFLTRLDDACKERRARLITLSHVAHTDGRMFPLRQVCEIAGRRRVMLAIDGAQAVGHVPVDLEALDVDFYFFSGHKWCMAPMGTGALVMTKRFKERHVDRDSYLLESSRAHEYGDLGTQNIGLISGLAKACEIRHQELRAMTDLGALRAVFRECLTTMRDVQIVEWDGAHAPGIGSCRMNGAPIDTTRLAEYLFSQYDIAVKPIDYPELPQMLRVSWSSSTDVQDIVFLAEKLEEALEFFRRH
jgi:selenocysteine lyase/cysteine desulfurase